jgi:pyruvate/2-oxoglutarate dehydrogenase complex dihydrolipoamide acyltransferase (E2) component
MEIVVPDLGLRGVPLAICAWLVAAGERVYEGDRVLDLLAGEVTVDVAAPVAGVLVEQFATEDEVVSVGQIVGRIAVDRDPDAEVP